MSPSTFALSHPLWVCGLKSFVDCIYHRVGKSHPLWVCGLKYCPLHQPRSLRLVTPFMGVWIEIFQRYARSAVIFVTPFMGVWIEIERLWPLLLACGVTPFMGVWIEIV